VTVADRAVRRALHGSANTIIVRHRQRRHVMSKEKRSTKEKRKPKKEKPAAPKK
jgi:hypothetical protein